MGLRRSSPQPKEGRDGMRNLRRAMRCAAGGALALAVLGTGVALILMSPTTAVRPLVTVAGFGVGPLQLHQGAFLVWAVATGLHVLGRLVPAVVTAFARPVPGAAGRASAFVVIVLVAALAAMVAVPADAAWRAGHPFGHRHHHARAAR